MMQKREDCMRRLAYGIAGLLGDYIPFLHYMAPLFPTSRILAFAYASPRHHPNQQQKIFAAVISSRSFNFLDSVMVTLGYRPGYLSYMS